MCFVIFLIFIFFFFWDHGYSLVRVAQWFPSIEHIVGNWFDWQVINLFAQLHWKLEASLNAHSLTHVPCVPQWESSMFELLFTVLALVFRPDGNEIAVATLDAQITFWNPQTGEQTGSIEGRHDLGYSRKDTDKITAKKSAFGKYGNS